MSIDQRLARLAPALTAQERAILILEAWKDDRPEDPAWRLHMPQEQTKVFNEYIELMNKANVVLGRIIGVISFQAEALEQREAWLVGLTLWSEHIEEIKRAVRLSIKEPITESEHAAEVEAFRDEWVPVEELAEFLAGYHDFSEDDHEETEQWGRQVRDEVWDRAVAEEEARLRALVTRGELPSRGRGKRLKLQNRALQHFGHDVGAASEEYLSYRIVPDDQAEAVEAERSDLRALQRVLEWQHYDGPDSDELSGIPEKMRIGLRETTAYRLISTWVLLRTVDVLVREIGEEFNGIDPLRPVFREKQEATRERLLSIREHLAFLSLEVELREPFGEEVEEMRDWLAETRATS